MRVLGRYMKMPAKPRKKPMSLSAFKKKVGCMLETISRLESTERTEAYGYLQNCVNVLGVHKLGLNQTDIANLMIRPESSGSSKECSSKDLPKEVVELKPNPIEEVKPVPSTSSSIQVSVISRNERANVINYSKSECHSSQKDKSNSKSLEPTKRQECNTSLSALSVNQTKETQPPFENVNERETVVSSTKIFQSSEQFSKPMLSPDTNLTQCSDGESSKEKATLISCVECGAKLKSRRAMLAHLDRHVLMPVSCRACQRSFNCLSALKFHFEDFCTSQSLVCPQCEEVFSCRTHFNNHIEGHNRNNCQMCPALFTNRKNLVVHMADAHNVVMLADAAFTCHVEGCERRFVKKSTLHRHLQLRHTSEGQLVCITCGAYCEGEDEYRSHSESHKQWTCEECSESFTRRQQYLVHMASHETSKYKCITCDQVLPTKARVLEHRKDGHQVEGLSVDFACDKCEQRFHTSAELRDHSHIHKPPGSISCKYCYKTFSTKKICNSHMRSQHGVVIENGTEASLICEQCGKQFRSPSLLAKHLKGVHNEKVYSCNYCDHKTNYEVNMKRHRALHTSQEQQFVCDQCGASFQALSTLKDHNLFVHSDERNFECNVCHKSFKRKNDLRRHQRSHSDDRKYVCHCKQSYKFMSHLRRHQEAAHKTVPSSRIVQRLVKDSSGNLMEKPKPSKAKRINKDKKHKADRIDIVEAQEHYVDDPVTPVQHDEARVQLISVHEDNQVVAMSVSDLPIADQHVDPYSIPVAYDGLSYPDPKAQLVYATPPSGSHVMSLQLPQFELVEPISYETDTVMDMSTTSHTDLSSHHGSMLMSIASSEPSSQHQPVMTLITGLEHNSLFTTQADIGTMTEHSTVYPETLLHHSHSAVSHVKSVDNYSEAHVLDPKTSQADISTMTDMYSVYESPANLCVNQHQHPHSAHHDLPPLNYPLDPCHSILMPADQAWHIHPEATNLAQYSTC
ncbi:Zinc finger protein 226 [Frankliniella fusca]|uniref:Zinc finger protein 226 n=1 Tax=Frankliniella fusca TaxID=407009 RepID=A0AAE1GX80_9NEOP|nr:Zinc finger protein 226 [Frankliniella fusca]